MDIQVDRTGGQTRINFLGPLRGVVPEDVESQVLPLFKSGESLILDFSNVQSLSGMSLRRLLLLARHARSIGCHLTVQGVPADLPAKLDAAGFWSLFAQLRTDEPVPVVLRSSIQRIDTYPTRSIAGFGVRIGDALPFGATLVPHGVNFSIFARNAESCVLQLFRPAEETPFVEIPFPPEFRIGDVFAMTVFDVDIDSIEYAYRIGGRWAPAEGLRYDATKSLLDPLARVVTGAEVWGDGPKNGTRRNLRGRIIPHDFDWNGDRPLQTPVEDLVVYELHVRGFTQSPTSKVRFPGTFAGLREKIPYLKELGVNCVELMPIFEFDECENERTEPRTGERLLNYWGYSTVAFCAPKASYAATSEFGTQADELKALIRALHQNGIEVILDVVFNHTAEGNEHGETISFRGIDNSVYYMLTPDGTYHNFSGCGNTFNCNHPAVREFVRGCLRMWVTEYHIDGFRFDLASILGRDSSGAPLISPPLLESLAKDAILGRTKLIAEAWDAGGLYQVGSFPSFGRWMEWNGKFRDCARRFLRGDPGHAGEMAQRMIGSPDMYSERGPTASVNFITCHDGFTLNDLVSYQEKHNEANGEENRDGTDDNAAWNCGVEGPSDDPEIQRLRLRQVKNAVTILFLSQGVPMIYMGDELGRSQDGNNNAYCHDSSLNWLDWTLREKNSDLFRFFQGMIRFRGQHPALRHSLHAGRRHVEGGDLLDVTWHGIEPWSPDWSSSSHSLALMLRLYSVLGLLDVLYVVLNMYWEPLTFRPPAPPDQWVWHLAINTASPSPDDIYGDGQGPMLGPRAKLRVEARSVVVLIAQPVTPELAVE